MIQVSLSQRIASDPVFRKALESAQTPEQKYHLVNEAGLSGSAERISRLPKYNSRGRLGSGGESY